MVPPTPPGPFRRPSIPYPYLGLSPYPRAETQLHRERNHECPPSCCSESVERSSHGLWQGRSREACRLPLPTRLFPHDQPALLVQWGRPGRRYPPCLEGQKQQCLLSLSGASLNTLYFLSSLQPPTKVVIITFTSQRRKLRFSDVKQYTHFIYQVMEITGFDGSRAYWNWVHFTCGTRDSAWE